MLAVAAAPGGGRWLVYVARAPKVNAKTAGRLRAASAAGVEGASSSNPIGDDRFGAMFRDSAFEVDEEDEEFSGAYSELDYEMLGY